MKQSERESRDLGLMVLILLLGLFFMLLAGHLATRLQPDWSLPADMGSNLDPNARFRSRAESGGVEPLRPEILTPPAWDESYLTPGPQDPAAETAVTVVVFDPSATPSATPSASPTAPTATVTASSTPDPTGSPPPPTPTATRPPRDDDPPPPPPPPPMTSTIDPLLAEVAPPADLDVGAPDGAVANLNSGTYTVVDMTNGGADPAITVVGPAETNYDLVYYEWDAGGQIMLDHVIIGISQDPDGDPYYEVFNWGDNLPDTNTNVDVSATYPADPSSIPPDPGCLADPECDNRDIPLSELYDQSGPPAEPKTGILIDVDNAGSHPPPGDYPYVVIISPDTGSGDAAQVDAVEQVDEPQPP